MGVIVSEHFALVGLEQQRIVDKHKEFVMCIKETNVVIFKKKIIYILSCHPGSYKIRAGEGELQNVVRPVELFC